MKLAIGSDHAGFDLKTCLVSILRQQGHTAVDMGTNNRDPVDYPDYAHRVAQAVSKKEVERGIVICGSGVGACITSNKVPKVRAAICHDTYSAHQGVEHDDMNVLVLGARIIGEALAEEIVKSFLKAKFSKEERHSRRLNKVLEIEKSYLNIGE